MRVQSKELHSVWLTRPAGPTNAPFLEEILEGKLTFPKTCGVVYPLKTYSTPFSVAVILAIVFGCFALILIIVLFNVVLHFKNKRKARQRELEMEESSQCADAVATMQLEKMNYLRNLETPTRAQMSFLHILNVLEQIKKFIPQGLLEQLVSVETGEQQNEQETGEEDYQPILPAHGRSSISATSDSLTPKSRSSSKSSKKSSQSRGRVSGIGGIANSKLASRKIVVLKVNYSFHSEGMNAAELHEAITNVLSAIVSAVSSQKGTLHQCDSSTVVATWGTHRLVADAPYLASCSALAIQKNILVPLEVLPSLRVSIGICMAASFVGNLFIGDIGLLMVVSEKFDCLSEISDPDLQQRLRVGVLVDVEFFKQTEYVCDYRMVHLRKQTLGHTHAKEPVFYLSSVKETSENDEEWMYTLNKQKESQDKKSTECPAFKLLLDGNVDSAITALNSFLQDYPEDCIALNLKHSLEINGINLHVFDEDDMHDEDV